MAQNRNDAAVIMTVLGMICLSGVPVGALATWISPGPTDVLRVAAGLVGLALLGTMLLGLARGLRQKRRGVRPLSILSLLLISSGDIYVGIAAATSKHGDAMLYGVLGAVGLLPVVSWAIMLLLLPNASPDSKRADQTTP